MLGRHLAVKQDYFLASVVAAFHRQPKEGRLIIKETMILIHSTWKLALQEYVGQLWAGTKWHIPFINGTETQDQHALLGMLPRGNRNGYIQAFVYL